MGTQCSAGRRVRTVGVRLALAACLAMLAPVGVDTVRHGGGEAASTVTAVGPDPAVFPIDPKRFAETREGAPTFDGQFEGEGQRAAQSTYKVEIGGRGAVPVDADGVVIYLTAVDPTAWGFMSVSACEDGPPVASSVNYDAGVTVGNEIVADLSPTGEVCVYTYAATDLTIDVVGYVPAGNSIVTLRDRRLLDTREGASTYDGQSQGIGRTDPGSTTMVQVTGRAQIPDGTETVIVNVAALDPTDDGFIVVHPCLATLPPASSLNYSPGVDRANELIAQVDGDGKICIFTQHDLDLIMDVVGYVPPGTNYVDVPSRRYLETRQGATTFDGQNQGEGIRPAGSTYTLEVAGRGFVPAGAMAVVANVAAVDPVDGGFLTVHPCFGSPPTSASLNYRAGVNGANEIVARVDDDGEICIFTFAATHLIVDVTGYLMPELTATTDSYATFGNVLLEVGEPPTGFPAVQVGGSVLDNDIAAGALTVTSFDASTTLGGLVEMDPDGTFLYAPPAGVTAATDTFEYTMSDGVDSDTATVMIDLTELVWFVDNTAGAGGDGTSVEAFDELADAETASGLGDTIFVFEGDGTDTGYDQGIALQHGQALIGEAAGLTVAGDVLVAPGGRPEISASGGADTVVLAEANTLRGLALSITGAGDAIDGTGSSGPATITGVDVTANSNGINLGSSGGTFTFTDVDVTSSGGTALVVTGGTATVTFDPTSSITATGGDGLQFDDADGIYDFQGTVDLGGGDAGIDILNGSAGTFTFADATITSPADYGVVVQNLAAGAAVDYRGGITNVGGQGLVYVDTTAAGTTIAFHQSGGSTFTASNTLSSGVQILDADGDIDFDTPITIDNAGFSAIFHGLGAGTYDFRDVVITNQSGPGNAGVDIIADDSTINFTNLDIQADFSGYLTPGPSPQRFGGLAFLAQPGNVVNIFGADNDLSNIGGPVIALSGGTSFDITLDELSSTDSSYVGPVGEDGVVIFQAGTGTFDVTGTTTIDTTGDQGIDIDGVAGTITFADVAISNTGDAGISTGAVQGAAAAVTIGGGTFDTIGDDALEAGLLGIPGSGGNLTVDDVVFTNVTGFIGDFFDSTLGGSGNVAVPFSCSDDGGNTGFITFNAGADTCP